MFHSASKRAIQLGFLFLITASFNQSFSQQSSVASLGKADSGRSDSVSRSEPKGPVDSASILASFVAAENKVREALNQHTFKRDVVLQTIGPNGEVTGEYIRNSQFLFDDRGRRIEKVLFHPKSTIREMRITKEDIQDLAGSQLLGIDIVEANKYRLTYAGTEIIDSRQTFAIDVTPTTTPNPHRMKERYFVGRVWVDPHTCQIVKIKGIVEPQGKQRFPIFETWREPIKNALAFPTRTEADDILHFGALDVHYRIKVRYYEYKQFGSKVSITEIDEPAPDIKEAPPTTNIAPPRLKPASPKSNEASPKAKETAPKISEKPATKLPLPRTEPSKSPEVCTINRNAPPAGAYHWPANSEVKVYFTRRMFTPEQSAVLLEAMKTWNTVGAENNSGVKFIYAGETDSRMSCRGCLTVARREVYKQDRHHYAFFHPMQELGRGVLFSAWIDLDVGITEPKALQGFMAHELGHGLGLWDCPGCKKKQSLMNSFPGLNKHNGLIAPSTCDVATMKSVYREELQIAAVRMNADQKTETVRTESAGAVSAPVLSRTELGAQTGGASASQAANYKQAELIPSKTPIEIRPGGIRAYGNFSPLNAGKGRLNFFDARRPQVNRSIFLWNQIF
jgi:hypothetical protein